jgi:hypothetical protein
LPLEAVQSLEEHSVWKFFRETPDSVVAKQLSSTHIQHIPCVHLSLLGFPYKLENVVGSPTASIIIAPHILFQLRSDLRQNLYDGVDTEHLFERIV